MRIAEQVQRKLNLEKIFMREVARVFNVMRNDFRLSVSAGKMINAQTYKPQWVTTLRTHYKRVQNAFRGIIQDNSKQAENDEEKNDELLAALLLWIDNQATKQAVFITDTNQQNIENAVEQARQALSDEGRTSYTNRELAAVAVAILTRKIISRLAGITTLETQAPAESTKLMEAYSMADIPPDAVTTGARVRQTKHIKQWVTMRDERVRPIHAMADGQTRRIEEPYIVGGEKLMYPGDGSLGASLGNLINCRCSSRYFFEL